MTRNWKIGLLLLFLLFGVGSIAGWYAWLGWKGGRSIAEWESLGADVAGTSVLPEWLEDGLPDILRDRFDSPRWIRMQNDPFARLPSLRGSRSLEGIYVGGEPEPGLELVVDLRDCPRLERVEILASHLQVDLRGSDAVESLDISPVHGGQVLGWEDLGSLQKLKFHSLDGHSPKVAKPEILETLSLALGHGTHLQPGRGEALPVWLAQCSNLRKLGIRGEQISEPAQLEGLNSLPHLAKLSLALPALRGEVDLAFLPVLESLSLKLRHHPEVIWRLPNTVKFLSVEMEDLDLLRADPDWSPEGLSLGLPYQEATAPVLPLHERFPASWRAGLTGLALPNFEYGTQSKMQIDLRRFPNLENFSCGDGFRIAGYSEAKKLLLFSSYFAEMEPFKKGDFARLRWIEVETDRRIDPAFRPSWIDELQHPEDPNHWIYRGDR